MTTFVGSAGYFRAQKFYLFFCPLIDIDVKLLARSVLILWRQSMSNRSLESFTVNIYNHATKVTTNSQHY